MSLKYELNSNALKLVFGKSEKGFLLAPLNSNFYQSRLSEPLIITLIPQCLHTNGGAVKFGHRIKQTIP